VTSTAIFGCRLVIVAHAIRSADSVLYRLSFHLVALSGGRHTECACYGEIRISIFSSANSTAIFGCRLVIVSHAIRSAEEWWWSSLWRRCQGTREEQSLLALAGRGATELTREGESSRRGPGIESTAPVRTTRAPVRTARVAEGNRETARVGAGLSAGGESAKSGK
jgi:hypothetical protein